MTGRIIQIYYPTGDARSLRIAFDPVRVVQVTAFPRSDLAKAKLRPECNRVGTYFLVGEVPGAAKHSVYVGEAEDCLTRLKQHDQGKEFWSVALVSSTTSDLFTKSHVRFLEWLCYREIQTADRYSIENTNIPTKPAIPEAMEAQLSEVFDTLRLLVAALGYPLFEPLAKLQAAEELVFHLLGRGASARAVYSADGMVVLKGSTAAKDEVDSAKSWLREQRLSLTESGVLVPDQGRLRFTQDYAFGSPSGASCVVLGRDASGWAVWKLPDGRALKDVFGKSDP